MLRKDSSLVPGTSSLVKSQGPIIRTMLDCAEDIMLEWYHKFGSNKNNKSMQVSIFKSEKHSQFTVNFNGMSSLESVIMKKKERLKKNQTADCGSVLIYPPFRDIYYSFGNMEEKIFAILENLRSQHPLFNIVMTGHSLGAAMATMCAARYAIHFPMINVSCHVFGSPRVGGVSFHKLCSILPNLKIIRLENISDPWVFFPEGAKWSHVGHSVVLRTPSSSFVEISKRKPFQARAYKFDMYHPGKRPSWPSIGQKKKFKSAHDIITYVRAIEQFTHLGYPWIKGFCGKKGKEQ
eukprot:CAMPEP_0194357144 /NCGR_PEP_ID=MMETSP0174-20130528/4668_1 /TAXON_ID=216777 /ORGANISM="Proboscia alata, Strain PI-D3" /LENGTH=292 /DNA_ID=CAMNT_0039127045 /DNA_START=799 /DNA_END=1677 /DNA_ORIENTATION=-